MTVEEDIIMATQRHEQEQDGLLGKSFKPDVDPDAWKRQDVGELAQASDLFTMERIDLRIPRTVTTLDQYTDEVRSPASARGHEIREKLVDDLTKRAAELGVNQSNLDSLSVQLQLVVSDVLENIAVHGMLDRGSEKLNGVDDAQFKQILEAVGYDRTGEMSVQLVEEPTPKIVLQFTYRKDDFQRRWDDSSLEAFQQRMEDDPTLLADPNGRGLFLIRQYFGDAEPVIEQRDINKGHLITLERDLTKPVD